MWCHNVLRSRGASSSTLIAATRHRSEAVCPEAGLVARLLGMILSPFVGWLTDVRGIAWVQLLSASAFAVVGRVMTMPSPTL